MRRLRMSHLASLLVVSAAACTKDVPITSPENLQQVAAARSANGQRKLGTLPSPEAVRKRRDALRKHQFRCEAYDFIADTIIRVGQLRLPRPVNGQAAKEAVKLVEFTIVDLRTNDSMPMRCGIPASADPNQILKGLTYQDAVTALNGPRTITITPGILQMRVSMMTLTARVEAREMYHSAKQSVVAATEFMAAAESPTCNPNTPPSQGCTLLTGINVTAPWESIFTANFGTLGTTDFADAWTNTSDEIYLETDDQQTVHG